MRPDQSPEYGECPVCGYRMVPVLDLSPCGHDAETIVRALDAEGTIYSWTRLWTSAESSTLVAMADFLDGTLRIAAPVGATDSIEIGDRVVARRGDNTPLELTPTGGTPS
jgi:uncharacterized OB-fold protein